MSCLFLECIECASVFKNKEAAICHVVFECNAKRHNDKAQWLYQATTAEMVGRGLFKWSSAKAPSRMGLGAKTAQFKELWDKAECCASCLKAPSPQFVPYFSVSSKAAHIKHHPGHNAGNGRVLLG